MRKALDVLLHFFEAATALLGSEGGGGRGFAGTALPGQECIGEREVTINMLLGDSPRWKRHPSSQQKHHCGVLCKDAC